MIIEKIVKIEYKNVFKSIKISYVDNTQVISSDGASISINSIVEVDSNSENKEDFAILEKLYNPIVTQQKGLATLIILNKNEINYLLYDDINKGDDFKNYLIPMDKVDDKIYIQSIIVNTIHVKLSCINLKIIN